MDLMTFISWGAVTTNLFLYAAGIPECMQFYQDKSTGVTSAFPFIAMLASSSFWLVYGVLLNNALIWQLNVIGSVMQLVYLLFFVYYAKTRRVIIRQLQLLALFGTATLVGIVYASFSYKDEAIAVLGILSNVLTIITCGAPLSTVSQVFEMKNTSTMSPTICFACFLSSVVWLVYGFLLDDVFLQVPNGLGTILGLFQLALFVAYPRKRSPK